MPNNKLDLTELRESVQDVNNKINFMAEVFTSELIPGEEAKAGALIFFNSISIELDQVASELLPGERRKEVQNHSPS